MTSNVVLFWTSRLAAATIFGAIALLPVSPASAHSELLESTPAAGAELSKPPTEVQLIFGESVQQQGGSIEVAQRDTIVSQSNTFATKGNVASVQLTGPGQPGTYTVSFRVVSVDGHVVSDTFEYEVVGAPSTSSTSAPSETPSETPADDQSPAAATNTATDDSEDSSGSVVWVLGLGAIGIVLVAAMIAVAVRGRRDRSD
jgi:methionine-rich copper-binding protein CopC